MDPQSVTIFTLMMVSAFAAGWFIARVRTKEMRQKYQMRQRQVAVAGFLHDMVAADLTALIARLEAMAISMPEKEQALQRCAATARKSMSDIRTLVDELNAQAINHPQVTVPALTMTVMQTARALQEAGFHVETTTTIRVDPGAESINRALSQCLSEARACLLIVGLCSSMIEVCHNGLDLRSSRMHSGSELNHFCQRM
ncbi:histidine kinase, partial [Corynebacterium phoceense]|uniref:histidine kinase n=1 Tax=Corynebacterium phoceense TaxID=1686286 RepID=UPI00211D1368